MADPLEESVNIVDFIPEEEPRLVPKSPDLKNTESPIQKRDTQYKNQSNILTSDSSVASALRNGTKSFITGPFWACSLSPLKQVSCFKK